MSILKVVYTKLLKCKITRQYFAKKIVKRFKITFMHINMRDEELLLSIRF